MKEIPLSRKEIFAANLAIAHKTGMLAHVQEKIGDMYVGKVFFRNYRMLSEDQQLQQAIELDFINRPIEASETLRDLNLLKNLSDY